MSTIRVDNFGPSAGGTTYSARGIAKAWVNFNGTGTIATRDSENVSSLTDNATGQYYINITSNMADANYCFTLYTSATDPSSIGAFSNQYTGGNESSTGSFGTSSYNASFVDSDVVTVCIHGDLA